MPKYIVKNTTNSPAKELKPGIGEFRIPPNAELEIVDIVGKISAKELAESLVADSGGKLELVVK